MVKDNIKIQIRLIIILCIFLSIPYKGFVNKKVYDPKARYQVLKKINRSNIETLDDIMIVFYDNSQLDLYDFEEGNVYVKKIEKIIYLENYEKDLGINEGGYKSYVILTKDNNSFYFRRGWIEEINEKNYESFIYKMIYYDTDLYIKKVKPFIPRLQTPKEFYNNFKEYFSPYYLGEYEFK
ncbi:hypothetical protein HP397_06705 [Streptobacillus felis]|uniref:Uncharacterized protein n=1 Tax=Streptobacillus felis TaxID=1384509 RepID=A0A7Z0PGX5_9FUSO|nr:hypothetical protein [Streptobacillus felis]NYV28488.1 hypothetical protein [Streptobacillus felis]